MVFVFSAKKIMVFHFLKLDRLSGIFLVNCNKRLKFFCNILLRINFSMKIAILDKKSASTYKLHSSLEYQLIFRGMVLALLTVPAPIKDAACIQKVFIC